MSDRRFGQRQVEDFESLASSFRKQLQAERDENRCRKDFTPTEAELMARALAPYEQRAAKDRQGERTDLLVEKISTSSTANLPSTARPVEAIKARSADKVAEAVGMSRPTLEKVHAVVEAAKADPIHYGDLPKKMDATGKVDPVFKEAQARAETHPVPA